MGKISSLNVSSVDIKFQWQRVEHRWRQIFSTQDKRYAKASVRYRIMQKATAELLANGDGMSMLQNIVQHLVPDLGDWCLVNLAGPQGGLIRFSEARSMGRDKSKALDEIRRKFPPNPKANTGLGWVIRSGQSELATHFSCDAFSETSKNQEYLDLWKRVGIASFIAVPIIVRGRVYGGIAIDSLTPARRYDRSDLAFMEEIASLMGLALEKAELLREVREASQQKDHFLAMLSHELKTPISAVLGWSELLLKKPRNPNLDVERAITVIERNARQQKALVDDILDLSLVTMGRMHLECGSVDLKLLLRSAIDSTLPLVEAKNLKITTTECDEDAMIMGDASRLQQCMLNIINNAIKFTPADGNLDIRLSQTRDGAGYSICFKDSGIGIESQFLPFIFDRFRQVDSSIRRSFGGLGLGLALVDSIVRLHGGNVWAESEGKDRGTSIVVSLQKLLPGDHLKKDLAPSNM